MNIECPKLAISNQLVLKTIIVIGCLLSFELLAEIDEKYQRGMHVVMTGTGSAFPDPQRAGASVAVIVDGTILQFDFGRGVMDNLLRADINPLDIDYVFFTHHHFDHIASYDYFVIALWIGARQQPVQVYGAPGTEAMHAGALQMHASDYEFVKFIVANWPPSISTTPATEPPVVVRDVKPGVIVDTDLIKVTAVSTPHYPEPDKLSLGYRVDSKYGSVVISGDTGPSVALTELAKGADILIHEMMKPDPGMLSGGKFSNREFQESSNKDFDRKKSKRPQTGHTTPTEVGRIGAEAGVKKLVAYHLAPFSSLNKAIEMTSLYLGPRPGDHIWGEMIHAVKKEYGGPFILAEDGMVFTIPAD